MRHDWVFDVLRDLLSYAQRNDLPALAARVEAAMAVARAEIAAAHDLGPAGDPAGGARPGRAH